MNLAEFLLARIGDDEDVARKATQGRWKLWGMRVMADTGGDSDVDKATPVADTHAEGKLRTFNASHIARHDPARVLAECAAKRAIVGWYESLSERVEAVPALEPRQNELGMVLRALAAVYSDHLEYRADWAV